MPVENTVSTDLLGLTARIVAAHLDRNPIAAEALPAMIKSVSQSLASAGAPDVATEPTPTPAVAVKRSVFPDYIVCLEDSKRLKMLKRHLQASFGMSPAEYRAKWGLPLNYPMTAPNYARTRSSLAKSTGLGRKPKDEVPELETDRASEPHVMIIPTRTARGSKG